MPAPKDSKKREEWIEKQRIAHQGKHPSEETKEKMREVHTGKKFSEEHKANIRITLNRPEVKAKKSAAHTGVSLSPEHCAAIGVAKTGVKLSPEHCSALKKANSCPEVKARRINLMRELWQDLKYVAKQIKARHAFPNKPEKFLDELLQKLFPNQWKYVGSGNFFVEGTNKNPDFIHVNQKKIIEHFGDFWHGEGKTGVLNEQHEQERIDLFAKYGYQTLVIWEHELNNLDLLVEKIVGFVEG